MSLPAATVEVDCCVVGGGPAGMMAGLLFARAGLRTVVLEKHADFLRDFRGDTVHPSTMILLDELGLLDAFLQRPHDRLERLLGDFSGDVREIASLRELDVPTPFIAFMPQWEFLDFLADHARTLPTFTLLMRTEAEALLWRGGAVVGVGATGPGGPVEIRARLTVAADGRRSVLRRQSGLKVRDLGAAIDVLWFRISKQAGKGEHPLFRAGPGGVLVTIDRGDYWQCAFVIRKGGAEGFRAEGLPRFRDRIAGVAPVLAARVGELREWDQVKLLTVAVDRLERWHRPGLLLIGDAAHAMSPIGGVGINLAIQDAVAAANLLAEPLASGELSNSQLASVARRRLFPVRVIQRLQVVMQNRLLIGLLDGSRPPTAPMPVRVLSRLPFLGRLLARLFALGIRPEHIRSPERVRPAVPAPALSASRPTGPP